MNLKRSFLELLSACVTAVLVSVISTFVLFPMFGFTVNTLSLFGLVLAIGLVVDDAIVVVEAVEHHIEHGPVATRGHLESDGRGMRFSL
jgi:multidrug efflux pump subunit AcrB